MPAEARPQNTDASLATNRRRLEAGAAYAGPMTSLTLYDGNDAEIKVHPHGERVRHAYGRVERSDERNLIPT